MFNSYFLSGYSSLEEIDFWFLSNWMEYDHSDSFLFDYEPNGTRTDKRSVGQKALTNDLPEGFPIWGLWGA